MSVAFYIVLDNEDPGFDTFVNGKALAKEAQKLEAISKKLGIPTFEDFIAMSADDIEGMLDEEVDIPEQEEKWFSPEEGLGFIQKVADHIRANPSSVTNPKAVLDDLGEYEEVFTKATVVGARWHLNLDI